MSSNIGNQHKNYLGFVHKNITFFARIAIKSPKSLDNLNKFNSSKNTRFCVFQSTRKTPGFPRLCSQSRFRFIGIPRLILRNSFCLDFTDGTTSVGTLYQMHDWQVAGKYSRWRWHLTAKTGEHYVIKRFDIKFRISPRNPDFSGFLLDQVTRGDLRIPKN